MCHVAHGLELCLLLPVQRLLLFRWHFWTAGRLVTELGTIVTDWWLLAHHFALSLGRWRQLKTRMHILTLGTLWTKAGQVVHAKHTTDVTVSAAGSVATKAAIVPRTVFDFAFRVNVQEGTLFVVAGVEP